jgi:transposase-like protein
MNAATQTAEAEEAEMQEPIDTVPTAQAKQRRKLPPQVWKAIKRQYLNGENIAEVAKQHGIAESSIYAKATRYSWPKRSVSINNGRILAELPSKALITSSSAAVNQATQAEMPAIQAKVAAHIGQWLSKVEQNANDLQERVAEKILGKLEVEEIKTLALTLSSLNGTMRSVFGLDQPGGPAASPWAAASLARQCPVIDVEPVPAQEHNRQDGVKQLLSTDDTLPKAEG